MKCLLVSDLHYTLKQLDWVDRVATDFDVVIMAGDHLDIASAVALEAQIVVMLKYLARLGSRAKLLVMISPIAVAGSTEEMRIFPINVPSRNTSISEFDSTPLRAPRFNTTKL